MSKFKIASVVVLLPVEDGGTHAYGTNPEMEDFVVGRTPLVVLESRGIDKAFNDEELIVCGQEELLEALRDALDTDEVTITEELLTSELFRDEISWQLTTETFVLAREIEVLYCSSLLSL